MQAAWNRVNRAGGLEQSEQGRWSGTEETGQAAWDRGNRAGDLEQREQGRRPGTERTEQAVWDGGSGQVAYPGGGRVGQWGIEECGWPRASKNITQGEWPWGLGGRRQKKK